MASVHEAARFFIWKANADGTAMSHLKLQKLCYYAQGHALALWAEPMFDESIEAWEHGPVIRALWDEYKMFQDGQIDVEVAKPEIETWRATILDAVYARFGWMTDWDLRNRTHGEAPWRDAYNTGEHNAELAHESLRDFFRAELRGARRRPPPVERSVVLAQLESDDELRELTAQGRAALDRGDSIRWR